ncbi:MAG: class I tRNA ligase family protein [Nanoarchaeota archaeon]
MKQTKINFKKIEKKWQDKWEKSKCFHVKENKSKKFYNLEMFPYPSGSGLHMGHALNYTIGDVYARFKRMQKFNVLYPMGYDSFGLPAENAAIKEKQHPRKFTELAIKNFIKQQKSLGLSYDWSRLIKTSSPEYYKWNQYFFLKFLENGLVYRKKAAVNFCKKCDTVLANEQVHNGKCWRHEDTEVEFKQLEQWFIRTTKYADELLDDIEKLDWPEKIKIMQKNWIGKSQGTEIFFEINREKWPVFTTRSDTLFGVTFIVISAQHPRLFELVTETQKPEVEKFLKKIKSTSEKEILEKEGVFTGSYAINPINNEKVPIYAGNFVLADYGSGMVMAVPAHDQRDFEFAKKYNIKIKTVIKQKQINCIIVHGCPSHDENNSKKRTYDKHWIPYIKKELLEREIPTYTPIMPNPWMPDYNAWKKEFEKSIINEDTILIGHSCGSAFLVRWLGDTKRHINKLILVAPWKIADGSAKKEFYEVKKLFYDYEIDKTIKSRVKRILMFTADNEEEGGKKSLKIFQEALGGNIVELKGRGHYTMEEMGTDKFPELLKEIVGEIGAYTGEGILVNSGKFNNLNNKKAIHEITKYLSEKKLAKSSINYKLKDWLVSRQRYWGTPIPIIYCEKCGIVPVPESQLPIKLPEKVKFGKGNPLSTNKNFLVVKCPKCNKSAKRETDTMDTFFDSSWYFLRYCDSKNNRQPFDQKKIKYWMTIDQYIGGAEHACMHLIYARFFTKALRDLKLLNFNEPFTKLFNQGMLHGEDGFVMSKSRGNVVLPEQVSKKYGIDTARFFLVSIASPDKDIQWSEKGIEGGYRFVNKIVNHFSKLNSDKLKNSKSTKRLEHVVNKTIKLITDDIENFKYNLAVIKLRELFEVFLGESCSKKDAENFLKMLSIFCPHITEELWEKIGNKSFLSLQQWPKADETKIDENLEKQDQIIENTFNDINNIIKIIRVKQDTYSTIYLYVIPNELAFFNQQKLSEKLGVNLKVFSVNDSKKYDPKNKSLKAKPGKPGIYVE